MQLSQYYVYIIGNRYRTVLYVGITGNLHLRVEEHKRETFEGFTKQFNVKYLLYYEIWDSADKAIAREKQLKKWHRQWKIDLIKETNPTFRDLSSDLGTCA